MSELGGDGLDVPSAIWGFHDWDSTHLAKLQGDANQVEDEQQQAFTLELIYADPPWPPGGQQNTLAIICNFIELKFPLLLLSTLRRYDDPPAPFSHRMYNVHIFFVKIF